MDQDSQASRKPDIGRWSRHAWAEERVRERAAARNITKNSKIEVVFPATREHTVMPLIAELLPPIDYRMRLTHHCYAELANAVAVSKMAFLEQKEFLLAGPLQRGLYRARPLNIGGWSFTAIIGSTTITRHATISAMLRDITHDFHLLHR